jgi:hypothetical protein
LPESAIYTPPLESTATLKGLKRFAAVADFPSPANPAVPLPAMVETDAPAGLTWRMRWLN